MATSIASELLYLNPEFADVYFTFKSSDERVLAHKIILAAMNSVFKTAFYGSMPIKDEFKIDDEDTVAAEFKEFLKFFYFKDPKLSMEHIQIVMHLCHKYQVDDCFKVCWRFLKENITIDELCLGYQLAIHYEQKDFREICRQKIYENAEEVLKSNGFLNCDWSILSEIAKSNVLMCRESTLLEACIVWAQNQCERKELNANDKENVRNQLKDVIYDIQFSQITFPMFVKYLEKYPNHPYNIDEMNDIILIMGRAKINSTKFNCSLRATAWIDSEKIDCQRYRTQSLDTNIRMISETIFSSNKPLVFGGFYVSFKPWIENVLCVVSIERMDSGINVIDTFTNEICILQKRIIMLPKPIIVEENIKYKIQLIFPSNIIQYHSLHQQVVLSNGATITFHEVGKSVIDCLYFNEIN